LAYFDSAKTKLEEIKSDPHFKPDTYPIVTLSEYHVKIINKFDGVQQAKVLAREYANTIYIMLKTMQDPRLQQAWTDLTNFTISGHKF